MANKVYQDAEAAFRQAAHVFKQELWQHRGAAHSIEARGTLVEVRQADGGIQTIKLEGAVGKSYYDKAYEAGWAGVVRQSPQHGPKLKEFFAKAN